MAAAPPAPTSRLRVVVGEEELLRARAVAAVRRAVLDRHPDAEEHELVAAGLPAGQLADVLAPSLFGGHRLVVVLGVHEAAAALAEALTGYAKDPDPELTLVLVHFGGKRNDALLKAFTAAGAAVDECAKIKPRDLTTFVRNEVRLLGGRILPDAATALVDAVGNDLRQLSGAASQLVADFGGDVTAEVVARFHQGQADVSGFRVADQALRGHGGEALRLLRWALNSGEPPVKMADAFAECVRTAARVKSLRRMSVNDLMRQFKWNYPKAKDGLEQSEYWSIEGLQRALALVAELNAAVKGGAASADYALERAVRQIVELRAATGERRGVRAVRGR